MNRATWPWPNFTPREMTCKCGCGTMEMDATFMSKLQLIRSQLGKPMPITSAYRCPKHNANVSSTGTSGPHTTGHAADIRIYGRDAHRLVEIAIRVGMKGIGIRQKGSRKGRFVHLDDLPNRDRQPRPWIWSY